MPGRGSTRTGRFAVAGVAAVLMVAVATSAAGCSGGGSGQAGAAASTPSATASPTASAASTAAAASPTLAPPSQSTSSAAADPVTPESRTTGTYLRALLPGSNLGLGPGLPAGWTADTGRASDSGPTSAAPAPALAGDGTCDYVIGDANLASGLSVAYATEPLAYGGNRPVGLSIYAFNPGDAAESLARIRQSLTTTCVRFTALQNLTRVPVEVTTTAVPNLGDEALLVKVQPQGPYTADQDLLIRRGDLLLSFSADNTLGPIPDMTVPASLLIAQVS